MDFEFKNRWLDISLSPQELERLGAGERLDDRNGGNTLQFDAVTEVKIEETQAAHARMNDVDLEVVLRNADMPVIIGHHHISGDRQQRFGNTGGIVIRAAAAASNEAAA